LKGENIQETQHFKVFVLFPTERDKVE